MRIAAISDIHGNLPALEAVLADIAAKGADVIVNLGDILSGPLWPRETAELLMAKDFPTIAGNHERHLLDCARTPGGASDQYVFEQTTPAQQAWLAALPGTLQLTPEVFLCHGTPTSDITYFCETVDGAVHNGIRMATQEELQARGGNINAQVILCGHSHQPRAMATMDGRLIVNPGSVGIPAYDDDHIAFHVAENGSPHARYCIIESGAHGWSVTQCAVAYDWNAAIAQAKRMGREDVALWLTGKTRSVKEVIDQEVEEYTSTTPNGLLTYSKDYLLAAIHSHPHLPVGAATSGELASAPVMYLIGHSIELSLKSFLLYKGFSLDALKQRFGHDIHRIIRAAAKNGLKTCTDIPEDQANAITALNFLYKSRQLNYIETGVKRFPLFELIRDFSLDTFKEVGTQIGYPSHALKIL